MCQRNGDVWGGRKASPRRTRSSAEESESEARTKQEQGAHSSGGRKASPRRTRSSAEEGENRGRTRRSFLWGPKSFTTEDAEFRGERREQSARAPLGRRASPRRTRRGFGRNQTAARPASKLSSAPPHTGSFPRKRESSRAHLSAQDVCQKNKLLRSCSAERARPQPGSTGFRICVATRKGANSTALAQISCVVRKRLARIYEKYKLWKCQLPHRLFSLRSLHPGKQRPQTEVLPRPKGLCA